MSSVLNLAAALNHFAPQLDSACLSLREIKTPHKDLLSLAGALIRPDSLRCAIRKLNRAQLRRLAELKTSAPLTDSDPLTQQLGALGLLGVQAGQLKTLPEATWQLERVLGESAGAVASGPGAVADGPAGASAGGSAPPPHGEVSGTELLTAAPASQWWHAAALATTHCDTLTRLVHHNPVKLIAGKRASTKTPVGVKTLRAFAKQLHLTQQLVGEYFELLFNAGILSTRATQDRGTYVVVSPAGRNWLRLNLPERWSALVNTAALQTAAHDRAFPGTIAGAEESPLTVVPPAQYLAEHPLAKPQTLTAYTALHDLLSALGCALETGYNPVFSDSLKTALSYLQSTAAAGAEAAASSGAAAGATPDAEEATIGGCADPPTNPIAVYGLDGLAPQQQTRVYLQPDQTILCPGPASPALADTLWLLADPEQLELASTWRISRESLGRAVAAGVNPDAIRRRLSDISLTGVPQPLRFTLAEMAAALPRESGAAPSGGAAVSATASSVTSPAANTSTGTDEGTGPAETAGPQQPTPLAEKLAGLGAIHRELLQLVTQKPGGDTITNTLQLAARGSIAVTVAVTSRGQDHSFTLVPRAVASGRLRGVDPQNEIERTIPLSAITAVTVSDHRQ